LVPPTFLRDIEDSGFSTWLRESESPFAFYFVLLFHTFGLALLVGANTVVDLRILGVAREIPLAPLKRLFGIMWLGFGINALTGVLLIIAYPTKALTNPVFYMKLTCIAFALWIVTMLKDRVFNPDLDEATMMKRGAALAKWSLVLWIGAISAGRLLAYTYKYLTYPC
jgi:hypothetical protein